MAYFNVDDQFHGHPKARKAGLPALGLWAVAGSHCRAYKSDGFVPAWYVDGWKARKLVGALVGARLWHERDSDCDCLKEACWPDEEGWMFHDWEHIHDPSTIVEKQREQGRERQRKRRAKLREDRGVNL